MPSLHAPICRQLIRHARRPLLVDDQGQWSGCKILIAAWHMSRHLQRATEQSNVGLMLPTSGLFAPALLGCWQAGKTAVPMNYLLEREALHHVIADSGLDTIVTVSKLLEHMGGKQALPTGIKVVLMDQLSFKGIPPLKLPRKCRGNDLAVLLYTSGTSGLPKGVMLSHNNLDSNVRACIKHAGLNEANAFLGILPNFHAFGITVLTLAPLFLGARAIYTARFIPRRLVELMRTHKPDIFVAVPSMFAALNSVKSATPEDAQSLKLVISGAEPLPDSVQQGFQKRFGKNILEGYGLTETSPVTHWSTPQFNKTHSVGRALPSVDTYIIGEDGHTLLDRNQKGEIFLAGPGLMQGYWQQPELTEEAIAYLEVPNEEKPVRCLRTGDIGKIDNDGYLFITGRKKEMLIVSGENVFPREIEECLCQASGVQAAGVVGRKDPIRGEIPVAYVESEDGAALDPAELRNHCQSNLPTFKVPREVVILEQLPRNPTGKILRRELQQLANPE